MAAIINVNLPQQSYEIAIGQGATPQEANAPGSIDQLGEMMHNLQLGQKVLLVSNPTVFKHYGERAVASLKTAGFEYGTPTRDAP